MNREKSRSEGRGCQQNNSPDYKTGSSSGDTRQSEFITKGDRQGTVIGLLIAFFVLLVHGSRLSSQVIGIDTEDIIRLQGDFYEGWLISGRQGLVLLKRLLGNYQFNPYYTGAMTLLLLWGAVIAFIKIWELSLESKPCRDGEIQKLTNYAWLTGAFLWISHPVLAEQFYFTLQSMEICVGFLLTAGAVYLIMCAVGRHRDGHTVWEEDQSNSPGRPGEQGYLTGRRIILWLAGTLLAMLTFTIYQAFVVFFIFGALSVLLLDVQRAIWSGERLRCRQFIGRILPWAASFFLAFAGGSLVGTVLCGKGDYLTSQIQWGEVTFRQNILRILKHIADVLTGYSSVYFHFVFGFLCLSSFLLSLVFLWKKCKSIWLGILWMCLLLALMSTPFWMTILCGGAPVIRSQLILPAVTGYLAYYTLRLFVLLLSEHEGSCGKEKMLFWAVTAVCVTGIFGQSQVTLRLYYTDACRYEQDAALGRELILAVEKEAQGERYPVVTIGSRPFSPNNACLVGETIGHSFFDHDTQVEPSMYWSSRRVIGFFHTLGFNAAHATPEMTWQAIENSKEMPVWPEDGSVRLVDGVIIIKLSNPEPSE